MASGEQEVIDLTISDSDDETDPSIGAVPVDPNSTTVLFEFEEILGKIKQEEKTPCPSPLLPSIDNSSTLINVTASASAAPASESGSVLSTPEASSYSGPPFEFSALLTPEILTNAKSSTEALTDRIPVDIRANPDTGDPEAGLAGKIPSDSEMDYPEPSTVEDIPPDSEMDSSSSNESWNTWNRSDSEFDPTYRPGGPEGWPSWKIKKSKHKQNQKKRSKVATRKLESKKTLISGPALDGNQQWKKSEFDCTRARSFRCHLCSYTVQKRKPFISHMVTHHNIAPPRPTSEDSENPRKLPIRMRKLGKKKTSMDQLNSAPKMNPAFPNYKCRDCDYTSKSKAWFDKHMKSRGHGEATTSVPDPQPQSASVAKATKTKRVPMKRPSSSKCPKWLTCHGHGYCQNQISMHGHKATKSFKCQVCDYSAENLQTIKVHEKTHCVNIPNPVPEGSTDLNRCAKCGLELPFKTHGTKERYTCRFCGSPTIVKRHVCVFQHGNSEASRKRKKLFEAHDEAIPNSPSAAQQHVSSQESPGTNRDGEVLFQPVDEASQSPPAGLELAFQEIHSKNKEGKQLSLAPDNEAAKSSSATERNASQVNPETSKKRNLVSPSQENDQAATTSEHSRFQSSSRESVVKVISAEKVEKIKSGNPENHMLQMEVEDTEPLQDKDDERTEMENAPIDEELVSLEADEASPSPNNEDNSPMNKEEMFVEEDDLPFDDENSRSSLTIVNLYSLRDRLDTAASNKKAESGSSTSTEPDDEQLLTKSVAVDSQIISDTDPEPTEKFKKRGESYGLSGPPHTPVIVTADKAGMGIPTFTRFHSGNGSTTTSSPATTLGVPSPNSSEHSGIENPFGSEFRRGSRESDASEENHIKLMKKLGQGNLIKHIKINNFMCIEKVDQDVGDIISFTTSTVGRSAHVLAMLLGFGYDLLFDLPPTPINFCGWPLTDLVRHGKTDASIELTISLESSPELRKKYSSEVTLIRSIHRGNPLASTPVEIRYKNVVILNTVPIMRQELRHILGMLNVSQSYHRIMVLDENNIHILMSDTKSWYDIYDQTVLIRKGMLRDEIKLLEFKVARTEKGNSWRQSKLQFLKTQLAMEYPEHPAFRRCRDQDLEAYKKTQGKIDRIQEEFNQWRRELVELRTQLLNASRMILERMQKKFQEFLDLHEYVGNIIVDSSSRKLAIWAQPIRPQLSIICPPLNTEEAHWSWNMLNRGDKMLTMMGLYLAFWEVADTCPVLAVDSFGKNPLGFNFSKPGLPALLDLIRNAPSKGQQIICSLESEPQ